MSVNYHLGWLNLKRIPHLEGQTPTVDPTGSVRWHLELKHSTRGQTGLHPWHGVSRKRKVYSGSDDAHGLSPVFRRSRDRDGRLVFSLSPKVSVLFGPSLSRYPFSSFRGTELQHCYVFTSWVKPRTLLHSRTTLGPLNSPRTMCKRVTKSS